MLNTKFLLKNLHQIQLLYLEVASYREIHLACIHMNMFLESIHKGMYQYMVYAPYSHNKINLYLLQKIDISEMALLGTSNICLCLINDGYLYNS